MYLLLLSFFCESKSIEFLMISKPAQTLNRVRWYGRNVIDPYTFWASTYKWEIDYSNGAFPEFNQTMQFLLFVIENVFSAYDRNANGRSGRSDFGSPVPAWDACDEFMERRFQRSRIIIPFSRRRWRPDRGHDDIGIGRAYHSVT